jgi:hypothetical protein
VKWSYCGVFWSIEFFSKQILKKSLKREKKPLIDWQLRAYKKVKNKKKSV